MEQSSGGISAGMIGAAGVKPQVATGCLYLFALPFCAFGLFAAVWSVQRIAAGDLRGAAYTAMFALVFAAPAAG